MTLPKGFKPIQYKKELSQSESNDRGNMLYAGGFFVLITAIAIAIGTLVYSFYSVSNVDLSLPYSSAEAISDIASTTWNWGIVSVVLLIAGKIIMSIGKKYSSEIK